MLVDLVLDEQGESAIRWAHRFATDLSVPIIAWVMVDNQSAERSIEIEREFEAETAASARAWLHSRDIVVDELRIASGARAIDLMASAQADDVVVLGVDSTEGFSPWALGSHAHELVHGLRCPLIIVPPGAPALDIAPIIVGVDGTDDNGLVLRWATLLARALRRELVPVFAYSGDDATISSAHLQHVESDAPGGAVLDELTGRPARVLTDVSLHTSAYLTVVGSHSEHSLRRLLAGSVVDSLLHHAPRPIAIIPHSPVHPLGDEMRSAVGEQQKSADKRP
ncbi:MAG: universal stress protein [Ilumatobacteraceae bacterium]